MSSGSYRKICCHRRVTTQIQTHASVSTGTNWDGDLRLIESGIESYLAQGVPAPRSISPITGDYGR